ncbi:MAG: zinc-binding alcohol dehydrogenase family protein [Chloroflexota bacterium]
MRAVRFDEYGGYDVLKVVDVPTPEPGPDEVLVKLTAAAVNPFDNTCRNGWVAAVKPGTIQGNEGSGVVVGDGSEAFPTGTRVMVVGTYGYARPGTWQEYVTANANEAIRVPDNLTDVEAAAVPVAYLGAQLALTHGVGLKPGMSLLIPGIGGSVGNAAVQLARIHGAGRVITSAGRTEKAERARAEGYEDVIDLSQESLSEGVMRLTDGKGVEVALDSIGGRITGEALKSLSPGGRLIQMGYPAGTDLTVDSIVLIWGPAGTGSTSIHGFNIYFQPGEAWSAAWDVLVPLLSSGQIKPLLDDHTYPLEEAAEATRHLIEDRPYGKVVLTIG